MGFAHSSVGRVCLQCRRPWFDAWVKKICWGRDRLPTPGFLGFPCGSADKESAFHVEDLGSIPGLGRCPREGKGYPLQYSGLENSMDCTIHGVAKSRTYCAIFTFAFNKIPVLSLHFPTLRDDWLWVASVPPNNPMWHSADDAIFYYYFFIWHILANSNSIRL